MRFEFNTEKDVSEYQMEEVVKYWFTSIGDNFEENKDLISEFNIDTKDANLGYFTQLAWARTFKIGKSLLTNTLMMIIMTSSRMWMESVQIQTWRKHLRRCL